MGTIIVVIAGILVFLIAVISPHLAGKIQYKTNEEAGTLKRIANWFWDPLTWITKSSIEFMRKALIKLAQWGKKTRRKFSSRSKK
jgi:hypothetical protein